jgi:hypothetical protein
MFAGGKFPTMVLNKNMGISMFYDDSEQNINISPFFVNAFGKPLFIPKTQKKVQIPCFIALIVRVPIEEKIHLAPKVGEQINEDDFEILEAIYSDDYEYIKNKEEFEKQQDISNYNELEFLKKEYNKNVLEFEKIKKTTKEPFLCELELLQESEQAQYDNKIENLNLFFEYRKKQKKFNPLDEAGSFKENKFDFINSDPVSFEIKTIPFDDIQYKKGEALILLASLTRDSETNFVNLNQFLHKNINIIYNYTFNSSDIISLLTFNSWRFNNYSDLGKIWTIFNNRIYFDTL